MKIPRFSLFAVSAAFAFGLACGPTLIRAETPEEAKRREATEAFLKVRKTEEIVNSTVAQLGEMTDRISDTFAKQAGPSVNVKEFTQKLQTEAREAIRKELNWETVKSEFVQAYSQAFTEAELKEMTAFYQTPTGKKLAAVDPEISGKLSKLSQEKARAVIPRVVQHIRELVAATKPPGSSPGPLAPPLPPGMTAPPPPPPGLMIPPPPPPGAMPSVTPPAAPPTMTPPPALPNMTAPVPPPTMTPPPAPPTMTPPAAPASAPAPSSSPTVHPGGKTEPGTP